MLTRFFVAIAVFCLLGSLTARADDKAALAARLQRVDKLTALDDPALKPWAMKISFEIFDGLGKPKEQGTLEEWWAGPELHKIAITSPSYTATEIVNKDGRFRTAGAADIPYMLELLERQMVHPIARPGEVAGLAPMTVKIENAPGTAPECIMLSQPMRNVPFPPLGILPTYCMAPGKDLLQASYDYGNLMVARTALGTFQQKVMPIDIKIAVNRLDAAASHLLMLKSMSALTEPDFAPAAGMERIDTPVVHMLFRDLQPEIVGTPPRQAPPPGIQPSALSAPVQVKIRIGTDGVVHWLRLESTPDSRMAAPAMWIAANTKFSPHKKDGKVVEVETTANIFFSNGVGVGEIGPGKRH